MTASGALPLQHGQGITYCRVLERACSSDSSSSNHGHEGEKKNNSPWRKDWVIDKLSTGVANLSVEFRVQENRSPGVYS